MAQPARERLLEAAVTVGIGDTGIRAAFIDWFAASETDAFLPSWQYTYINNGVLPGLRDRGVADDQIEQILVRNPRDFFAQQA
jgi:predicted metal-dependent phosphotriesterase family hydrolase